MALFGPIRERLVALVRSERGMALPTALFAMIASMGLASAAILSSVNVQQGSTRDSGSKKAIAAADAGAERRPAPPQPVQEEPQRDGAVHRPQRRTPDPDRGLVSRDRSGKSRSRDLLVHDQRLRGGRGSARSLGWDGSRGQPAGQGRPHQCGGGTRLRQRETRPPGRHQHHGEMSRSEPMSEPMATSIRAAPAPWSAVMFATAKGKPPMSPRHAAAASPKAKKNFPKSSLPKTSPPSTRTAV